MSGVASSSVAVVYSAGLQCCSDDELCQDFDFGAHKVIGEKYIDDIST